MLCDRITVYSVLNTLTIMGASCRFNISCSPSSSASPCSRADLAPTGTLRAAFLATNPVQGRIDPQTGAITGPVADLVRELAARRQVPYTLLPVPDASAVIDSVKSGKADVGFLAYEAARAAQVDFSDPYALMANAYAVSADSSIRRSADVDRAGVKIGAVKGQSQEIYVSGNIKNARVQVLPAMPANEVLAGMLAGGELDVFAANRQRMEELARTSSKVRVLADNFLMIGQAMVVDKGNRSSLDELNRFLADVRASGFVQGFSRSGQARRHGGRPSRREIVARPSTCWLDADRESAAGSRRYRRRPDRYRLLDLQSIDHPRDAVRLAGECERAIVFGNRSGGAAQRDRRSVRRHLDTARLDQIVQCHLGLDLRGDRRVVCRVADLARRQRRSFLPPPHRPPCALSLSITPVVPAVGLENPPGRFQGASGQYVGRTTAATASTATTRINRINVRIATSCQREI